MSDQLSDHFCNIFNTYLAAFRKGFGWQTTLLRLFDDWKRELDNHRYVEPFSLFHHGVVIRLECFSMMIHCIS